MNDRFLFRGKTIDGVRPHFVIGHYVSVPRPMIVSDKPKIGGGWDFDDVDPATVGQCTGLRDKSGTLIFEGDILSINNDIAEVEYYDDGYALKFPNMEYIQRRVLSIVPNYAYSIIGNIHESPAQGVKNE